MMDLDTPESCTDCRNIGTQSNQDNRKSSKKNNKYQLLYTYGLSPDDGPRYARILYRLANYWNPIQPEQTVI